ncbi:Bbp19 family protein [Sphingobium yanoikuyae]|uniref:Bbp19 family protein n=1 Tax=Sphingobium yanoikuyae TaxID=13690 RepID=UPI0035AE33EC
MPRDAPLPSITAELFAVQQGAESNSVRAKRHARQQVDIHRAYQRLFFDEGGRLTDAARLVLFDIMEEAAIGLMSPSLDHAELAAKEGKRRLALHIIGRFQLSEERLRTLERQLNQEEEE